MGWDVLFQDLPAGVRTIAEVPEDFRPKMLGRRHELLRRIARALPEVDFSDPAWGVLDGSDFSVEINIGASAVTDAIMLHVHGQGGGAIEAVRRIARAIERPAIDCRDGEILDFDGGHAPLRALH
jgi:hypothetical protein